jgi:predicted nucleic acid-binding Zn ribbon protein
MNSQGELDPLEIGNQAKAIQAYLKASGGSLELQNKAAEIRLRSDRKAGELLKRMEKNSGSKNKSGGSSVLPPKLDELGLNKTLSSRLQQIATLPEVEFESHNIATFQEVKKSECCDTSRRYSQLGYLILENIFYVRLLDEVLFAEVYGNLVRVRCDDATGRIDRTTCIAMATAVDSDMTLPSCFLRYRLRKCNCERYFLTFHHSRQFCSEKCAKAKASQRQKLYREAKSLRLRTTCIMCSAPIQGVRSSKQFCSAKCRQRACRRWR